MTSEFLIYVIYEENFILFFISVPTANNAHKREARLQLIYSLKILAHFRSKVLVDFLHYVTRINSLTGAIISETHTTNKYIYITKYDPPHCHI
jgi:hypothetical protein